MQSSHERRLDGAVPAGELGIGETVEVRTKMGVPIVRGDVCGVNPFGVTIKVDGIARQFYAEQFYLFVPEEPDVPVVASNMLTDMHPDARVAAKLGNLAEQEPEAAGNTAQAVEPTDGSPEAAPSEEPPPQQQNAVADDSSSVDMNALPPDIRKAVVTINKLNGDQMNLVLSQTGQALMSALRRSGVAEAELHGLVQRSQNAIYKIMTGKNSREWKKAAQATS